jgi:hypothetical protein
MCGFAWGRATDMGTYATALCMGSTAMCLVAATRCVLAVKVWLWSSSCSLVAVGRLHVCMLVCIIVHVLGSSLHL